MRVIDSLKQHFRPEFLNRVDDIVVFHPLGEAQLTHIIDLRLADLTKMLADRKITLELTEAARKAIFKAGYDRAYGATAAEAGDPADGSGQAGGEDPGRQRAAWRYGGRGGWSVAKDWVVLNGVRRRRGGKQEGGVTASAPCSAQLRGPVPYT